MTAGPGQRMVNLAVCGKFHMLNYVAHLTSAEVLNRLYFSARPEAAARFGLDPERAINLPLKEYLIQGHGRLLGDRLIEELIPAYHSLWAHGVMRRWSPAPVLHLICQGACLPLIARAARDGSTVIGEVVNTHPSHRLELMQREAERWELPDRRAGLLPRERQILEEVAQADVLLAPSRVVAESYRARGVAKRALVLPYSANISRFSHVPRASEPGAPLRIICVGRLGLRKGQLYLLEALAKLGLSDIELTLVGSVEPQTKPHFADRAALFRHIERVPSADMPDLLRRHDVAVMPSIEEGLAVSICEAMACGLGVIASEESGAGELIRDGANGLLVKAGDSEGLARAILRLYRDRDEMRAIGEAAAAATRSQINWQRYAAELVDFYRSVAASTLEVASLA